MADTRANFSVTIIGCVDPADRGGLLLTPTEFYGMVSGMVEEAAKNVIGKIRIRCHPVHVDEMETITAAKSNAMDQFKETGLNIGETQEDPVLELTRQASFISPIGIRVDAEATDDAGEIGLSTLALSLRNACESSDYPASMSVTCDATSMAASWLNSNAWLVGRIASGMNADEQGIHAEIVYSDTIGNDRGNEIPAIQAEIRISCGNAEEEGAAISVSTIIGKENLSMKRMFGAWLMDIPAYSFSLRSSMGDDEDEEDGNEAFTAGPVSVTLH